MIYLRQFVRGRADGVGQINLLFHMILYVQRNEETSHLKIVHFHEPEKGEVPSELESNAKSTSRPTIAFYPFTNASCVAVLDEAFPEITIDLVRTFSLHFKQSVPPDTFDDPFCSC